MDGESENNHQENDITVDDGNITRFSSYHREKWKNYIHPPRFSAQLHQFQVRHQLMQPWTMVTHCNAVG